MLNGRVLNGKDTIDIQCSRMTLIMTSQSHTASISVITKAISRDVNKLVQDLVLSLTYCRMKLPYSGDNKTFLFFRGAYISTIAYRSTP